MVRVLLLDKYGDPADEADVPDDPLPVTVVHAERVYLRTNRKALVYREVTSFFSPDTASVSFKVIKGNGD